MQALTFAHPRPALPRPRILPVFLPWQGCARRCAFCHQPAATGGKAASLAQAHAELAATLAQLRRAWAAPLELGFYGGTFTALPDAWIERFLALAGDYRAAGLVCGVRASTRPDAVDDARLADLQARGLTFLEIGAQSFDAGVLAAAGRGHGPEAIAAACGAATMRRLPFALHLMAGLPGQSRAMFRRDVETALALGPAGLRLHPCLVLEGTPLAQDWRAGRYRAMTLGEALPLLGWALGRCWAAGVPVQRIGLAREDALDAAALAGPQHPAMGQRAASLALFAYVRKQMTGLDGPARRLLIPRRHMSDALGWRGELRGRWSRRGVTVEPWEDRRFRLE